MRSCAVLLAVVGLSSGCVTLSGASRRVALAPSPGAPPELRGSPGIGLATRIPFTNPVSGGQGSGIAVPAIQPELNGVFRFAEHAYGSFDLNFSLGGETRPARNDLPRVEADLSFGALIGGGYDFPVFPSGGIHVSGEGGFNFVSVTTTIGNTSAGISNVLLFAGRIVAAPYLELKAFRLFAGGVVGSDVWSDATGFAFTCSGCSVRDSARTEATALVMLGGGARFQPSKMVALGAEVWVPVTTAGVRQPPQVLLALQLGNFDFSRSQRPPEPPAAVVPAEDFVVPPPPPLPVAPELMPTPVPL